MGERWMVGRGSISDYEDFAKYRSAILKNLNTDLRLGQHHFDRLQILILVARGLCDYGFINFNLHRQLSIFISELFVDYKYQARFEIFLLSFNSPTPNFLNSGAKVPSQSLTRHCQLLVRPPISNPPNLAPTFGFPRAQK